ncbi:hypothetical protein OUZ56_005582 [Daphnia magna]|uniref:Uncharacterized protein n=1 Tax=Daphnia magna TaxID=35525 RepID=A0ABQ9YT79_9CRUS|nr:hypothetical protein OUZ56_005582 [Daphnia magna]
MGYVTEMYGERHVDIVLVHPGYFNPCSWLAPPQSLRRDIEMGTQINPGPVPSAPVTIVNIPTPPTPVGAKYRTCDDPPTAT